MTTPVKIRVTPALSREEDLENLRNEVAVLRRAVESKSAGVNILRTELQACQRERDKLNAMVEQGSALNNSLTFSKLYFPDPGRSAIFSGSDGTLAQLLSQAKVENKSLRLDNTELRCKLHDAQADIKVLREEVNRALNTTGRRRSQLLIATSSQLAHQEREQFISQMESLNVKCQALEGDVRGLVEEREELVKERDTMAHKIHRLNYIVNHMLDQSSGEQIGVKSSINVHIDLDGIITENKYLQQRLKQTEEEKKLAKSTALKYKSAVEKCRSQGMNKLGSAENVIITPKQVSEMIQEYKGEVGSAAEMDLKSLCVALVDALNQRSRALKAQKAANRVLLGRVSELERRLTTVSSNKCYGDSEQMLHSNEEYITSSLNLLDGYTPPSGPITSFGIENTLIKLSKYLNSQDNLDFINKDLGAGVLGKKDLNVPDHNSFDSSTERNTNVSEKLSLSQEDNALEIEPNHSLNKLSPFMAPFHNVSSSVLKLNNKIDLSSAQDSVGTGKYLCKTKVPYCTPKDNDFEEIIPLDQLDSYIKQVNLKRKLNGQREKNTEDLKEVQKDTEDLKEIQKDTEDLKEIQKNAEDLKEIQKDKDLKEIQKDKDLKEIQKDTEDLKEIQKYTEDLKEIKIVQEKGFINQIDSKNEVILTRNKFQMYQKPSEILTENVTRLNVSASTTSSDHNLTFISNTSKKTIKVFANLATNDVTNNLSDIKTVEIDSISSSIINTEVTEEIKDTINEEYDEEGDSNSDDDNSYELDISDYDSDNDNLDAALQEWHNNFNSISLKNLKENIQLSPQKKKEPTASSKERKSKQRKEKEGDIEKDDCDSLPPALQELLEQTSLSAIEDRVDCA